MKKSCEPGPFLKPAKIASIPSVIGPDGPNVVLRQLVEQIVLSAHSSKQVLKLLASETDKMTISAILRVGWFPEKKAFVSFEFKRCSISFTTPRVFPVISLYRSEYPGKIGKSVECTYF